MKIRASIAVLIASVAILTSHGQSTGDAADFTSSMKRRSAALEALRKGEVGTADNLLTQAARGTPSTAGWHLDYADHLMAAAIDLKDRDKYKASTDYFHRAAAQLNSALTAADSPADAVTRATILHKLGFIARVADGNQSAANGYFKRALELDPANKVARAALQRTKEGRKVLLGIGKI